MKDTGVRLVIWDLDETFWKGTLTEGGITYLDEHHEIVETLARRGIMSSVCSKNDFGPVRDLLVEKGVWDYFIFPSIDWTPKGERIKAIIEDLQLRPDNVIFVDDNANNRAQALAAEPALRVFDVDAIAGFLIHPDFNGKNDAELTRLKQYKLLESKKSERDSSAGDPHDFLRQSQIRVEIIADIELSLLRAIELINRTNQLNFTKKRLPDDPQAAAAELLGQIANHDCRAGLVSARDRYGDYGVVGFFLMTGLLAHGRPQLWHFCFSCRTLGMGVEQYVYDLLGRPGLDIVGPVHSDPTAPVDWVNRETGARQVEDSAEVVDEVRIRGGCELEVLDYLFRNQARKIVGEYQVPKGIYYVVAQHSVFLSLATRGLSPEESDVLQSLGLTEEFTRSRFFDPCASRALLILSTALDIEQSIWRHRVTGLAVPIRFREPVIPGHPNHQYSTDAERREYERVTDILRRDFEPLDAPYEQTLADARRLILDHVPESALLIVLLPNYRRNVNGRAQIYRQQAESNESFRELGRGRKNVVFIDVNELIQDVGEIGSYYLHYQRVVYIRIFKRIQETWKAGCR